jgi:hypothetical protein
MGTQPEGRPGGDRDRRPTRVAFAGAGSLPGSAALPAFRFLLSIKDPVILMRRGINTQPGRIEFAIATAAKVMDWEVEWFVPEPGGRDQVFYRDIEMVREADIVLCVFPSHDPMGGGTGHVVEKAVDRGAPVYAYVSDDESPWIWHRLGEWDPLDSWSSRVPVG